MHLLLFPQNQIATTLVSVWSNTASKPTNPSPARCSHPKSAPRPGSVRHPQAGPKSGRFWVLGWFHAFVAFGWLRSWCEELVLVTVGWHGTSLLVWIMFPASKSINYQFVNVHPVLDERSPMLPLKNMLKYQQNLPLNKCSFKPSHSALLNSSLATNPELFQNTSFSPSSQLPVGPHEGRRRSQSPRKTRTDPVQPRSLQSVAQRITEEERFQWPLQTHLYFFPGETPKPSSRANFLRSKDS